MRPKYRDSRLLLTASTTLCFGEKGVLITLQRISSQLMFADQTILTTHLPLARPENERVKAPFHPACSSSE